VGVHAVRPNIVYLFSRVILIELWQEGGQRISTLTDSFRSAAAELPAIPIILLIFGEGLPLKACLFPAMTFLIYRIARKRYKPAGEIPKSTAKRR